ncbi:MAG: type II secretion system protein [Candidatus Nealsonbacteria bacterium]|nr:type II secretion system protein [Candidatus Nealsonbacteria bacterium]
MKKIKKQKGFTLIEILVVIGIIAILAAVVLIAINPARQFAQARDSQRVSNLNTILNSIGQRMADNKGLFSGLGIDAKTCPSLPGPALADAKIIDNAAAGSGVDLSCLAPTYVSALPIDPSLPPTSISTGYNIYQDANGRIHVLTTVNETSIPRTSPIEIVR